MSVVSGESSFVDRTDADDRPAVVDVATCREYTRVLKWEISCGRCAGTRDIKDLPGVSKNMPYLEYSVMMKFRLTNNVTSDSLQWKLAIKMLLTRRGVLPA